MRSINVHELGGRGLTSATGLRKTNLTVSQAVNTRKGKMDFSDPEKLLEELSRENYYLPKVTITRPDGATLMDIYRSKQADTWSRILRAQIKEEEQKKLQDKIDRERANERFGKLLRADLAINESRSSNLGSDDAKLAQLTEETSKRADDVQRKRREDAVIRQKQFIEYALQDIDTKANKRAKELELEIEASTMMINKVKAQMALDEKLKADKKAVEALRLEKLFIENQASLKRKEELKLKQFAEDKRIFREAELAHQREDKRRADDLASKTKQATDGPAHRVAAAITELHKNKEAELYKTLLDAGNLLNTQLQSSEENGASRQRNAGKGMTAEWDKNMAHKRKMQADEDERIRKLGEYNNKKLKDMAAQDEAARQKKIEAGKRYQKELDSQLSVVRQRQIQALTRTMSEEEELYNSSMLRKYGVGF